MTHWKKQLLVTFIDTGNVDIYKHLVSIAHDLNFEYVTYHFHSAIPFSSSNICACSNYPDEWKKRYTEEGYINSDPSISHCLSTLDPIIWSDKLFSSAPKMWEDSQRMGINAGWSKSEINGSGSTHILSLARTGGRVTPKELLHNETKMRSLAQLSTLIEPPLILNNQNSLSLPILTSREKEILCWTADGKSSEDISKILSISIHTVNFHIKNTSRKLYSSNKTATVVKAAVLGLLN